MTQSKDPQPEARRATMRPGKAEDAKGTRKVVEEEEEGEDQVDLYAEFGVPRTATEAEIKRAYHRLALRHHPDRLAARHQGPTDPTSPAAQARVLEAKTAFQRLSQHYHLLTHPACRRRYDATGSVREATAAGDVGGGGSDANAEEWTAFLADLYGGARLTREGVEAFAREYKGSREEGEDVLHAYAQHPGDFWAILDAVPLLELGEVERLRDLLPKVLPPGATVPQPDAKEWARRKREAKREASLFAAFEREAARERAAKAGTAGPDAKGDEKEREEDLGSILAKRGRDRMESMLAGIEAKYGAGAEAGGGSSSKRSKKKGAASSKRPPPELTDEEFAAAQARMLARKGRHA